MFLQYGFTKPNPLSCSDSKSLGVWNIYNSFIGYLERPTKHLLQRETVPPPLVHQTT